MVEKSLSQHLLLTLLPVLADCTGLFFDPFATQNYNNPVVLETDREHEKAIQALKKEFKKKLEQLDKEYGPSYREQIERWYNLQKRGIKSKSLRETLRKWKQDKLKEWDEMGTAADVSDAIDQETADPGIRHIIGSTNDFQPTGVRHMIDSTNDVQPPSGATTVASRLDTNAIATQEARSAGTASVASREKKVNTDPGRWNKGITGINAFGVLPGGTSGSPEKKRKSPSKPSDLDDNADSEEEDEDDEDSSDGDIFNGKDYSTVAKGSNVAAAVSRGALENVEGVNTERSSVLHPSVVSVVSEKPHEMAGESAELQTLRNSKIMSPGAEVSGTLVDSLAQEGTRIMNPKAPLDLRPTFFRNKTFMEIRKSINTLQGRILPPGEFEDGGQGTSTIGLSGGSTAQIEGGSGPQEGLSKPGGSSAQQTKGTLSHHRTSASNVLLPFIGNLDSNILWVGTFLAVIILVGFYKFTRYVWRQCMKQDEQGVTRSCLGYQPPEVAVVSASREISSSGKEKLLGGHGGTAQLFQNAAFENSSAFANSAQNSASKETIATIATEQSSTLLVSKDSRASKGSKDSFDTTTYGDSTSETETPEGHYVKMPDEPFFTKKE